MTSETEVVEEYILKSNWSYEKYIAELEIFINKIMTRQQKEELTFDILDSEKMKQIKLIVLKQKQYQMKVGDIWQEALGSYRGFKNLKVGHPTGLDIISKDRKIAIELKNRTNTDNSSSRKANLDKLANFKEQNPDYICIYGNVNADTEEKTLIVFTKLLHHNGVIIEHKVGVKEFLEFILGDDVDKIINFIKSEIDKYI